ncbi:GTP-binding protein 1 [Kappamyces sp. JEL0680]|nr:GTP-binding protein 1 [Kappamyces sp. JEL0680]
MEVALLGHLTTRLAEGSGECLYEIGVSDKGTLVGLTAKDMESSMTTLKKMGAALSAELFIVRKKTVANQRTVAEVLFRKCLEDEQHFLEIRVAMLGEEAYLMVGAADAGKSSLLGVLCYEENDNGRGKARLNLLRHRHEIESGRSSALAREIIGFSANGDVINYASNNVSTWEHIVESATKVVTFMDTCGHPKYQKTTIGGLTGDAPDYACVILSASHGGLPEVSREQILLTKLLGVPLMICVTKIDIATSAQLTRTIEQLMDLLKSPGVSLLPQVVQSEDDIAACLPLLLKRQIIPLFMISSVTGDNFDLLRKLFNLLAKPIALQEGLLDAEMEFQIQDVYNVAGTNVLGGLMKAGRMYLAGQSNPFVCFLGPDRSNFIPVLVSTIYRQRYPVRHLQAGQAGTVGLKFLTPEAMSAWRSEKRLHSHDVDSWTNTAPSDFRIRRGQVLCSFATTPVAYWEFEVDLSVVSHPSSIHIAQEVMVHCGSINQPARIIDISTASSSHSKSKSSSSPDPLSTTVLADSLPSPIKMRKKRQRLSSGTRLSQGEHGRVTFRQDMDI